MRSSFSTRLGFASLAAVAFGFLGTPRADANQIPLYNTLPVGHLTTQPSEAQRPTSIPSSETVQGFRIWTPTGATASTQLMVTTQDSPNTAPAANQTIEGFRGCFSQAAPNQASMLAIARAQGGPPPSSEWDAVPLAAQMTLWIVPGPRVPVVMHHEIVIDKNGETSLDSTDAWVDPISRGLRLISKASMPLKQVGTAPGGVRFFVGRDDRADGKRFVHLIVARAKDTPYQEVQFVSATRTDGSRLSAGACSHHRVSLQASTSLKAESAVLQFNTMLPDLPPGELSTAPPLPGVLSPNAHDIRTRSILASFSVSQTSRDKEPIVSLATSWAAGEVNQRLFSPITMTTTSPVPPPQQQPVSPLPLKASIVVKTPPKVVRAPLSIPRRD